MLLAAALVVQVLTSSPEGFLVNSTLVSGAKDAILIDADFTLADAGKVADAVKASGKNLTTIYVTHGHPDHYFGAVAIHAAFPKAKLVALPSTVAAIRKTWAAKVAQWQPLYKEGIPAKPLLPQAVHGKALSLEGETLELHGPVQGDDPRNSWVWIPSIKTAIAGDVVYDGVHAWTADSTPAERKAWIGTLNKLAALEPAKVVPGHQSPDRKQDPSNLAATRDYLTAFDEARTSSKTADELQQKVAAKYPGLALDVILKFGASAAFKSAAKE